MKQMTLRLPDELYAWLKHLAKTERRSLQGQCETELWAHYKRWLADAELAGDTEPSPKRQETTHAC